MLFWSFVTLAVLELAVIFFLADDNYKLHKRLTELTARDINVTQVKASIAACQFCGTTLRKIIRSKEGWWCCESCSILKLNQLPNQPLVHELLTKH